MTCLIKKHPHPSRSESEYCDWLHARLALKEIQSVRLYPSFQVSKTKFWKPDFLVLNNEDVLEVHESKGWNRSDDSFRLRLALFFERYPKVPVFVNKVRV